MDKVDVRATKKQMRQLEREANALRNQAEAKEREIEGLEAKLDYWEIYKMLVKEWRKEHGRKSPIPPTQWCSVCGNPMLTNHLAFTCSPWCRQAAYRKRKSEAKP